MNLFLINGRLTKDPEVLMAGDTKIARISIAVDRKVRKGEEKKTDFFNFTAFGKTADTIEAYFTKGKPIVIYGRVQNNNYEKDGKTVYGFQFIVDQFEFNLSDSNGSARVEKTENNEFMSIPDGIADEGLPFN